MVMTKKNIILIAVGAVIIIFAFILTLINWKTPGSDNINSGGKKDLPKPEFLTPAEKAQFKLSDNIKAQVLNRDASGTPTVYKLINNDYDVVADPANVAPISPRQQIVENK